VTLPRHGLPASATVDAARAVLRSARDIWHRRAREVLTRSARLTVAAVVSYVIAHAIFPQSQPLTAPLTSLLVVQATLFSTLRAGFRRLLSVVSGVLVAVAFSSFFGLTWWSLGAVIAAALVVGQLLRLGEHLLETPISAMLILGVSSTAEAGAASRVTETLIGAGVGVLINVVLPPPVRTQSAGAAVEQVAIEAAAVLDRVARELPEGASRGQALGWLEDFRRLAQYVDAADRAIVHLADSRRLNPRAVRVADTGPMLRSGLDALAHSIVSLRALFRSIADGVEEEVGDEKGYTAELLGAFGVLLQDLAGSFRAFGSMVRAEADGARPGVEAPLAEALEQLRETRAFLTELLFVDAREDPTLWLLRGSLLAAVDRTLRELDVEERMRRRQQWERDEAERRRARPPSVRLRETSARTAAPRQALRRVRINRPRRPDRPDRR